MTADRVGIAVLFGTWIGAILGGVGTFAAGAPAATVLLATFAAGLLGGGVVGGTIALRARTP